MRRRVVSYSGDPAPEVLFIGGLSNRTDEGAGIPFAGPVGRRFDEEAERIGVRAGFTFVARCNGYVSGSPLELKHFACRDFLVEQVRAQDPLILVAVGVIAKTELVANASEITRGGSVLRGRTRYGRRPVVLLAEVAPMVLMKAAPPGWKKAWSSIESEVARKRKYKASRGDAVTKQKRMVEDVRGNGNPVIER